MDEDSRQAIQREAAIRAGKALTEEVTAAGGEAGDVIMAAELLFAGIVDHYAKPGHSIEMLDMLYNHMRGFMLRRQLGGRPDEARFGAIANEAGRAVVQRITAAGGEAGDVILAFEIMLASAIMTAASDGAEDALLAAVTNALASRVERLKRFKAQLRAAH